MSLVDRKLEMLKNIIFIDIETVSCVQLYSLLNPEMQDLWRSKAKFFCKEDKIDYSQAFRDRAAIYSEFGKVIVIVIGFLKKTTGNVFELRTKAIFGDNEKDLLEQFKTLIEKIDQKELIFCGHNIKEFDLPYICRRMVVNSIKLPACLNLSGKKPWEIKHIDTMELWSFGDKKNFTSLHLLAIILGLESSKGNMDGSQVHAKYFEENKLNEIVSYCREDVTVTAKVFLRLQNLPTLDSDNVVSL